jgi:glutathione synthase/RimK-type ligase-like ATP-grasp enzyme
MAFHGRKLQKMSIIIASQMIDPHADTVIEILNFRGRNIVRMNYNEFPENLGVSMHVNQTNSNLSIFLMHNGKEVNSDEITSIWWRRPGKFEFNHDISIQERHFLASELHHSIHGFLNASSAFWVSHPSAIKDASKKIEQLVFARSIGLNIPKTLVSTERDEILDFYRQCNKNILYKVLFDASLGQISTDKYNPGEVIIQKNAHARAVKYDEIAEMPQKSLSPMLFQEILDTAYNIRVTIVGNSIFAARYYSHTCKSIDLLHQCPLEEIIFEVIQLPEKLNDLILKFVRRYNLAFSALDFIQIKSGDYYFIENNPNGQFGFIELLLPELKISESIAGILEKGSYD